MRVAPAFWTAFRCMDAFWCLAGGRARMAGIATDARPPLT